MSNLYCLMILKVFQEPITHVSYLDDVFSGYENNILIVKDDSGTYYVPGFGVMTLTEMCPGEGYAVFLTGMDDIDFFYPSGDMARTNSEASQYWSDYKLNSVSTQYEVVKTGISHPIIITELNGSVQVGDELVAYAGDMVVGGVNNNRGSGCDFELWKWVWKW